MRWRTNIRNSDGTDSTRGADNRQVLTPRAALQNPRNIPYIDGFGILKLPKDPGILRNSSELFENSRNFTRFLFCKVSPSGRRANATKK